MLKTIRKFPDEEQFSEFVKQHFDYLIRDFGFSITFDEHSEGFFGSRITVFESDATVITICWDGKEQWVDISIQNKAFVNKLLYGSYRLFEIYRFTHAKLGLPAPEASDFYFTDEETIETMIKRLAPLLREGALPFLRGDFSQENELYEFLRGRSLAGDLRERLPRF